MADQRVGYMQVSAEDYTERLRRLSRRSSAAAESAASSQPRSEPGYAAPLRRPSPARQPSPRAYVSPVQTPPPGVRAPSPGGRIAAIAGSLIPSTPHASPIQHGGTERALSPENDFYAALHYRNRGPAARTDVNKETPSRGHSEKPAGEGDSAELARALRLSWEWHAEAQRANLALADASDRTARLEAELEAARREVISMKLAAEARQASGPPGGSPAVGTSAPGSDSLNEFDELRMGGVTVAALPGRDASIPQPVVVTVARHTLYLDVERPDGSTATAAEFRLEAGSSVSEDSGVVTLQSGDGLGDARLVCATSSAAIALAGVIRSRLQAQQPGPTQSEHNDASAPQPPRRALVGATADEKPAASKRRNASEMSVEEMLRAVDELAAEEETPYYAGATAAHAKPTAPARRGRSATAERVPVHERLHREKPKRGRAALPTPERGPSPVSRTASAHSARTRSVPRSQELVVVRGPSPTGLVVRRAPEASRAEREAFGDLASTFYTSRSAAEREEGSPGESRRNLLQQWNRVFNAPSSRGRTLGEPRGPTSRGHSSGQSYPQHDYGERVGSTPSRAGPSNELTALELLGFSPNEIEVRAQSDAIIEGMRARVRGHPSSPPREPSVGQRPLATKRPEEPRTVVPTPATSRAAPAVAREVRPNPTVAAGLSAAPTSVTMGAKEPLPPPAKSAPPPPPGKSAPPPPPAKSAPPPPQSAPPPPRKPSPATTVARAASMPTATEAAPAPAPAAGGAPPPPPPPPVRKKPPPKQ